jgi:hypothetical protein
MKAIQGDIAKLRVDAVGEGGWDTEATRFGVESTLAGTRGRPAANPGLYEGTALPFGAGTVRKEARGSLLRRGTQVKV